MRGMAAGSVAEESGAGPEGGEAAGGTGGCPSPNSSSNRLNFGSASCAMAACNAGSQRWFRYKGRGKMQSTSIDSVQFRLDNPR